MFPNKNGLFNALNYQSNKIEKLFFFFSILHIAKYFKSITHRIYSEYMFLMLYADNGCLRSSKAQIQNQWLVR